MHPCMLAGPARSAQSLDAEDAWLQREWGLTLSAVPARAEESITHMVVAGATQAGVLGRGHTSGTILGQTKWAMHL